MNGSATPRDAVRCVIRARGIIRSPRASFFCLIRRERVSSDLSLAGARPNVSEFIIIRPTHMPTPHSLLQTPPFRENHASAL